MVSGGALLPPHIEKFFALTGLNVSVTGSIMDYYICAGLHYMVMVLF